MNRDRWQGKWRQFKGSMQGRWARLTHDVDRERSAQREVLAGKLQAAYGLGREAATRDAAGSDSKSWTGR